MNDIFISFLKGGAAVLWGYISSGSTETAIRAGVASLFKDFTADLPHEIRESIFSRVTLAILEAKSQEKIELEITAVMAEITEAVKGLVKP